MNFNLHTHTKRCNHAFGEDREYVENAIKAGIKVLGFSDHCPQFFHHSDYYSYFRMLPEMAQGYADSIRGLAKEYEKDIKILLGFEAEYYPDIYDEMIDCCKKLNIDYLILGQHLLGNEYDENSFYTGERECEGFLTQYVNQVIEGLQKGTFTYLAHPDLVNYKGEESHYIKEMTRLCTKAKEFDIPLEVNMLGMYNKRCYPNRKFWEIAGKVGNKAVIGFDAHTPDFFNNKDIYNRCIDMLLSNNLVPMDFQDIKIRKVD